MEKKLIRKYEFLRHKYRELLLPTFFMVTSEKICVVIDIIIIGILIGSSQLSIVNMASPITYFTGIFYILFGQGGNLLALRAQSQLQHEKVNHYFTLSILGIIAFSIIYILFIFFFIDNILAFFNTPELIFNSTKAYVLSLMFFYPFNCFILVISFFIRSDGYAKMPFYAVLISNIINIILDIIFLGVFHGGVNATAWASVLGYIVGTIYISTYLFKKKGTFKLISITKFKLNEIFISLKEIVLNTPEVIGKIFFSLKMGMLTYLCSTYLGVAGLVAFLVYDNSETLVYMFLSGVMKTMSPIVTVLYKEMDFEAVSYIIKKSIKYVLLVSFPISALLFVYPDILLMAFNVKDPSNAEVVRLALRITAFSLVGRCMSYLLANYAQAIEQNRISSIITFLEEFLFAFVGALLLTKAIGGIGIWFSILIAECVPVLIYVIYTIRLKRTFKDKTHRLFMIQNSKLITWTYNRTDDGEIYRYLDDDSRETFVEINNSFEDTASLASDVINDVCHSIFDNVEEVDDIDVTVRLVDDDAIIAFTTEGVRYNPFSNEDLMKSENIVNLSKLNCKFDFDEILGFNKSFIIVKKE